MDGLDQLGRDIIGYVRIQSHQQSTRVVMAVAQSSIGHTHASSGLGSGRYLKGILPAQDVFDLDLTTGYESPHRNPMIGDQIKTPAAPARFGCDTESDYQIAATWSQSGILHMIAVVDRQRYINPGAAHACRITDSYCTLATQGSISQRNPQSESSMCLARLLSHMIKHALKICKFLESCIAT